jgi:signal transduction histidine kinase
VLDLDRTWTRPAPTAAQLRGDALFGVGAAVLSVVAVEVWRSAFATPLAGNDAVAYLLFAVAGGLLGVRRRFPLSMLAVESVIFIAVGERQPALSAVFTIQIIMFVALYSAWAWSRRLRALHATTVLVLVAMFGWLALLVVRDQPPAAEQVGLLPAYPAAIIYSLVINIAYFFGAIVWGHGAWRSARQRAELLEQGRREADAQRREREAAIQTERVRIARDLHDVVAHHVSGIGVQAAGAGRVLQSRPDDARRALDTIERSSRQAVAQMHELVGLLREDDDRTALGPQPGLACLHDLAAGSPGRPIVTFAEVGAPFEVPSTTSSSLYRVAQEAVTNARRHAHAQHVGVTVRYLGETDDRPQSVEVEVLDDGAGPSAPEGTGGFGLAGIRERAAMHGGLCEIGPRPEGGFRVRVQVPVPA